MRWFTVTIPEAGVRYVQAADENEAKNIANDWAAKNGYQPALGSVREFGEGEFEAYKSAEPNWESKTIGGGKAPGNSSIITPPPVIDPDDEDGDGEITPDTNRGLESAGEYEAAFQRAENQKPGASNIGGAGLWNATRRNQFAPAFSTFAAQDALGNIAADPSDQDRLETFSRYIKDNDGTGYSGQAAKSFNDINAYSGTDPQILRTVSDLRNPGGALAESGMDASQIATAQRSLARTGYNIGRTGARAKQSGLWDRYVPSADDLYTGFLAKTGGEPAEEDWFDYLRKKGYA